MSISDSMNYVVIPGLNAGSYRGRIDSILEGDSGSEYSIYLRYPNGANADWVGTITGYYWLIDDESTVYTITGSLTIDSGDSSLMVWDVSAVDMAIAGQRRVVFSFGGKKSLSVVMNVEGDPRESVADTPPTVPSLSTVYQSVQDLATVASTGDYNDLINIPAGGGVSLGETSDTAYRGDRGKIAYDHSQLTSGNPHSVTASAVGLGNVDNTSDPDKEVSTATQTALNGKVSLSGDTMTGALTVDGSADAVQLTVQGHSTQTANLQEWQDSTGSVRMAYTAGNELILYDNGGGDYVALGTPDSSSTDFIRFSVGGVLKTQVQASGNWIIKDSAILLRNASNVSLLTASAAGGAITINQTISSISPLKVDAHASSTGNIQQWRNSSAAVLSHIDSSGNYQGLIGYFSETVTTANSGTSYSLDATSALNYKLTLTGNCALSDMNVPSGRVVTFTLELIQDGTGSRTVTWPAGTTWNAGTAPTLSTGAGEIDVVKLVTFDGGTTWRGDLIGANYS